MLVLMAAPAACEQALQRTQENLRQAGLAEVQVIVLDREGDGLGTGLNQALQAIGDVWVLLLWAGEWLADPIHKPDRSEGIEAYWLPVCYPAGERQLELRLFRNQPGLGFTTGRFPTLCHPARNRPWEGSALGTGSILRNGPRTDRSVPHIRRAEPVELLEAARQMRVHKEFRRAAALAGAAARRLPAEGYLAWEAAMEEAGAWEVLGDFGRAAAALQRILPYHPTATETHFRLGCCLGRLERWHEASLSLQACLDLGEGPWYYTPTAAVAGWRAQWALAVAREQGGDLHGAAALYGQAFSGNRALAEAPYRLATCLSRMGKAGAMWASLAPLLDAADPEQGMVLADILSVHGRYAEALQAVAAVESRLGVTHETACLRGYVLFMQGRFGAARMAFERLAPSAGLYGHALLWRLHVAWADDDWPGATLALRQLAKAPVAPLLRRLYGHLQRLLVDGGGFSTLSTRCRESTIIGHALLTLLHAFWTVGRMEKAERLLLLIPLLNWPQGYRAAGLLALTCALGGHARGRGRGARQRCLLEQAEQLLAKVEQPDGDVRLAQARLALARRRAHAAAALQRAEADPTWEGFWVWAQALRRLGSQIAPRARKERRS